MDLETETALPPCSWKRQGDCRQKPIEKVWVCISVSPMYGADRIRSGDSIVATIIAPTTSKAWGSGLLQWLEFTKLRGITIQGRGIIDGRGSIWWTYLDANGEPISTQLSSKMPSIKPTALRFYGSYNVTVTGITIQNSPQCHLKFDNCEAVKVFNMTVSSPGNSLNTDGIHLQNSRGVVIHHVDLACELDTNRSARQFLL